MAQATTTGYELSEVDKIEELVGRMRDADSIEDWSKILQDYIQWGNNKVHKSVAIFNMNSATDCVNRNTEHCQVPDGACYAYNDEQRYGVPLDYRRRQEYLWDCMDADTWAEAFLEIVDRKRNPVTAIRFSEAGDFRHRGDIIKVERIAQRLSDEGIICYTYSASDFLDWSYADTLVVNQSNDRDDYGDRRFFALPEDEDLPEDAVWCPFDHYDGDDLDNRPQCGECMLCLRSEGPDVAIPIH